MKAKADKLTVVLFCVILLICVVLDINIVYALLAGLLLFVVYALFKGFSVKKIALMCLTGIKTTKNILITFLLIGILTAMWRASGCIPSIVSYASNLILPSIFPLVTFLLCALVSTLTGTAFGTSATMGVICMSIANSMGMKPFWIGGAILAGAYLGDRCSPVSTSALLVGTLTKTDIYSNIKTMLKTALVPFLLSCLIYGVCGLSQQSNADMPNVTRMFSVEFAISPICLLPAVCILALALFKVNVKLTMLASIAAAIPITLFAQKMSVIDMLHAMVMGYEARTETLSTLINGGGIVSMLRVTVIVCVASCYSGIFAETGLLKFLQETITGVSKRFGNYAAVLFVAICASCVGCNQTFAIILTSQLTQELDMTDDTRAGYLENSAVITAPLVPWSIASTVSLSSAGAPIVCILAACYLYLIPIWLLIKSRTGNRNHK